jgi:nitronate monooxygenase
MQLSQPQIIQGGMGIGVSNWKLANAVSSLGQLGVISGTAIDNVIVRRLQLGDIDGSIRRALQKFPFKEIAEKVIERYFIPGGKAEDAPFKSPPLFSLNPSQHLIDLNVASSFVETYLAKEGHGNPVGLNLLTKIKLQNIPILFGALLAGIDYVLMGAGIPLKIPGVIDDLVNGRETGQEIETTGKKTSWWQAFNLKQYFPKDYPKLKRPQFFPIISSTVLALTFAKKANGKVDGFIIEAPTAGGHNAPPRDKTKFTESGEPVYTERDEPDLEKIRQLKIPFWLAGGRASKEKLIEAKKLGAQGVQIGTAFAMCDESGITRQLKTEIIRKVKNASIKVRTDSQLSPTGFPFKVVELAGTISEPSVIQQRRQHNQRCDLGYLREIYINDDGQAIFRCSAEEEKSYLLKGGCIEEKEGKQCLCNSLCATVGLAQTRHGYQEPPLITAGDSLNEIGHFIAPDKISYSAADVIHKILD